MSSDMSRFLFLLVPLLASALAPTPRSSQRLPGQLAASSAGSSGSSARTATPRTQTAKPSRPSGRTPSFTSQDLTNLVKNELAPNPKPWLPPQLSFRTDFPKTAAAVNELKGSVKASVADLKKTVEKTVEAVPIYRSAQSIARRVVPRRTDVAPRPGDPQAPAAPPRRTGRAPGLTSQDVAALVEGRPPTNEST